MANQCPCWQISPENHRKFGFPGWYFGYIPGTQMTLVLFEVLALFWRVEAPKIEVKQVPGKHTITQQDLVAKIIYISVVFFTNWVT